MNKPGPKNISVKKYEGAIRKCAGIQSLIAAELGINRSAVTQRIASNPHLQAVMAEVDEALLDQGEGVIVDALAAKDRQTARWYLERKGKARGYANKLETESKLSDADIESVVFAFGGDLKKLRRARAAIDPSQAE